jgi:parallel beta-helix repeat protein
MSAVLCAATGCFFSSQEPPVTLPSDVYVDAATGNDISGDGTPANPYRTISRAVAVLYVAAGYSEDDWWSPAPWSPVTLHVAPGIYNQNHGEEAFLLSNMNLVGEGTSRDEVVIAVGIRCLGDSSLRGVTASEAISLMQPDPTQFRGCSVLLDNASIRTIEAEECASDVQITNSRFGRIALQNLSGGVSVEHCESDGTSGMRVWTQGPVLVRDVKIVGGYGGLIVSGGSVTLTDNEIRDSSDGIYVSGTTAVLDGNTVSGCGYSGLVFSSETTITLADNEIVGNMIGIGIVGSTSGEIATAGTNIIRGNDMNIDDQRDAYSGDLFIRGITWDDPQPSGILHGPTVWDPGFQVHIENTGNSLVF